MANASLDDGHQSGTYRRIELITGAPRRRRWTTEEKARILAESFQPGARVSDIALRHGVNRGLVWSWRRQIRKQAAGAEPTFVPIRITQASLAAQRSPDVERDEAATLRTAVPPVEAKPEALVTGSIEIELGDARIRVSGAVDTAALRTVLGHLGRTR